MGVFGSAGALWCPTSKPPHHPGCVLQVLRDSSDEEEEEQAAAVGGAEVSIKSVPRFLLLAPSAFLCMPPERGLCGSAVAF